MMPYGVVKKVGDRKIKIEKTSSYLWSWLDSRGRREGTYRGGFMSVQDCVSAAESELEVEKKLPWWVGN